MLVICCFTCCVAPPPMVTIVITAATPMTIPRIVRKERMRLRRISRSERNMVLQSTMHAPLSVRPDTTRPSRKWTALFA